MTWILPFVDHQYKLIGEFKALRKFKESSHESQSSLALGIWSVEGGVRIPSRRQKVILGGKVGLLILK